MEPPEPVIAAAVVRPPGPTFAQGITRAGLGPPDLERALAQHAAYAAALEAAGVRLVRLPPDPAHPDSTFVEDTAVILGREAILTLPGAESRRGEVDPMRAALLPLVASLEAIEPPGTLDGGDVLETDRGFLIGLSERTNEAGARRLAAWLAARGRAAHLVAVGGLPGILHLKTGISWIDGGTVAAVGPLAAAARALGLDVIPVEPEEAYAANAIRVNGRVLIPSGAPRLERRLRERGCAVVTLDMSEFEKMDGGLSCLSLRLPAGG
ncbi:MAG TPA: arginine deiminase family protein [Candidatus Binatia bacterium]|nr:arginine deiminase family protein [Candidatus Binatia bacterium]